MHCGAPYLFWRPYSRGGHDRRGRRALDRYTTCRMCRAASSPGNVSRLLMSSIPLRGNHHQAPSRPSFSTSLSLNVRSTSHETPCRDGRPRAPRPWADDRERQRAAWRTLTTSTQPPRTGTRARAYGIYALGKRSPLRDYACGLRTASSNKMEATRGRWRDGGRWWCSRTCCTRTYK